MSARSQRIEVITRGERRRRWSVEQKREIATESLEPGLSPITMARRHGINTGQPDHVAAASAGGIAWDRRPAAGEVRAC